MQLISPHLCWIYFYQLPGQCEATEEKLDSSSLQMAAQ